MLFKPVQKWLCLNLERREIGQQNNFAQNNVVELAQQITGKGHILFHDSYFSDFEAVRHLVAKDIETVGTRNQRRKKYFK